MTLTIFSQTKLEQSVVSVTKSEVRKEEDEVGLTATGGIYFGPQYTNKNVVQPALNITQCTSNICLGLSRAHDLHTHPPVSSLSLSPCFWLPSPFMQSLYVNYWNKTQVFVICTWPTYSPLVSQLSLPLQTSLNHAPLATVNFHLNTQDLQPTTSTAQTPIFSFCPLTEAVESKLLISSILQHVL